MLKQTSSTEKAEVQATVAAEMNMLGLRSTLTSASLAQGLDVSPFTND